LEDCRDYELLEQSLLSLVEDETSDAAEFRQVQVRYQLHALIREFFATKLQERADAENLRRSFAVVLTSVAKTIPQTVTLEVQERVKEALPHLAVVAEQLSHLLEDSTDAMSSFTVLAWVAESQSLWAEAEKWYQACLQMTEERYGADHPDTATSLNNLAGLYYAMGRYSEAEPLLVRSLSINEQQLGAEHPDTATSLNNLAALYREMGRYPEAEPLCVRSLSIHEQQLGADHPDTALSLHTLGNLYYAMGRYQSAEPLYLRALKILFNQWGKNHPNTQKVWSNFIDFLQQAISTGQDSQLSQYPTTQAILQQLRETE
jgi:tetratricopeptide (TPR) repeat protein